MRLIDADALIKNILESTSYNDYEWSLYADEIIDDKINEAPTVEPKRGEWIRDTSSPIAYKCTACNTLQHWSVIQDGRYHFCPNCGAKMGEREGE